ncbi:MAG: hypothetical protein H6739_30670 [Alphaproteobacteria bacterium]|nr:hypothetical protein [Alphaproteobacteria bacterium]
MTIRSWLQRFRPAKPAGRPPPPAVDLSSPEATLDTAVAAILARDPHGFGCCFVDGAPTVPVPWAALEADFKGTWFVDFAEETPEGVALTVADHQGGTIVVVTLVQEGEAWRILRW